MAGQVDDDTAADYESDLLDLRGISLADVAKLPESALVRSLRRVLENDDVASQQYAGFKSAV